MMMLVIKGAISLVAMISIARDYVQGSTQSLRLVEKWAVRLATCLDLNEHRATWLMVAEAIKEDVDREEGKFLATPIELQSLDDSSHKNTDEATSKYYRNCLKGVQESNHGQDVALLDFLATHSKVRDVIKENRVQFGTLGYHWLHHGAFLPLYSWMTSALRRDAMWTTINPIVLAVYTLAFCQSTRYT
jgi:hypothetical protein